MTTNVIVHGMHRSPNFGDILLTQILVDHLEELPEARIRLLAPLQNVREILDKSQAELRSALSADAVILGGGGFFQRMDGPSGALKAILKYAFPLFLARLVGKRTAIIGAGAAPMPRRWLDLVFKFMVRGCDLIAVRDQVSFDYMSSLLGSSAKPQIHQASDLVFAIDRQWLEPKDREWAAGIIGRLGTERVLGVHLSEPPSSDPRYEQIARFLEAELADRPNTGILLLEDHPTGTGQAAAQGELATRFSRAKSVAVPYPGVGRLAALLAEMDAVLTSKLHVALCAATMGTMPFAIAKHRKNLASFMDIGLAENCCMIGDDDQARMEPIISAFVRHEGQIVISEEVRRRAQLALQFASKFAENGR